MNRCSDVNNLDVSAVADDKTMSASSIQSESLANHCN